MSHWPGLILIPTLITTTIGIKSLLSKERGIEPCDMSIFESEGNGKYIRYLIYLSLYVNADGAGALIQHGPLGLVIEQSGQTHPLLFSSRENILEMVIDIKNRDTIKYKILKKYRGPSASSLCPRAERMSWKW